MNNSLGLADKMAKQVAVSGNATKALDTLEEAGGNLVADYVEEQRALDKLFACAREACARIPDPLASTGTGTGGANG